MKSNEISCLLTLDPKNERSYLKNPWYSVGKWYSDTYTFDFGGCDALSKPGAEYRPSMSLFPLKPIKYGTKLLLAKWEVQEAN